MKKIYIALFCFFITSCANFSQTRNVWIQNDQNDGIYVEIDGLENVQHHKLAIIQHGLASNMDHEAVQAAKKAFLNNDFVVVTFDSRYSLGKGNNDVEKVRLTTFIEDLTTVTNWAKKQSFYSEPFALAGHSLGGASVIRFDAEHPDKVGLLVPITPVISGRLWKKSCMENMTDFCQQWEKVGTYEYTDPKNHKIAIIPYSVVESCDHYDAQLLSSKIKAKTLLIGAEKDVVIAPRDVQSLSNGISGSKTVIVEAADHNFSNHQNQSDLYQAIDSFLKLQH